MKYNQAGGIVSFVIVGVVLVGLLAGGLYLSKSQGRQARENNTTAPEVSSTQTKEDSSIKATENSGTTETKPAAPVPAPKPTSQTPAAPAPTPQANRVAATGPSGEIPATGPAETAAATITFSILVFTGYRLLQSRRALRRSSLRR